MAPRPDRDPGHAHRDLVLRALALLRRVGTASNDWQRSPFAEGFTVNHALVLHHLVKHGEATPSGLAAWMQVTRGSITPAIQRLEELGLVTRSRDAKDARRSWLKATAAGRRIAPQVEEKVLRPALVELKGWPPDELEAFVAGLERLLASPVFGAQDAG